MIPPYLVDVLAVHRLTHLVTVDRVARPIRDAWIDEMYERANRYLPTSPPGMTVSELADLVELDQDPPKGAYFITCPWCTSAWLGLAVVLARRFVPRLWDPVARALAASSVAGLIESR